MFGFGRRKIEPEPTQRFTVKRATRSYGQRWEVKEWKGSVLGWLYVDSCATEADAMAMIEQLIGDDETLKVVEVHQRGAD